MTQVTAFSIAKTISQALVLKLPAVFMYNRVSQMCNNPVSQLCNNHGLSGNYMFLECTAVEGMCIHSAIVSLILLYLPPAGGMLRYGKKKKGFIYRLLIIKTRLAYFPV